MAINSPFAVFSSFCKSAGFVAFAIGAVDVGDRDVPGQRSARLGRGDLHGLVGRVVEQLDVELLARIFKAADGFKQALDYVLLIEYRQLHGDARQFGKFVPAVVV